MRKVLGGFSQADHDTGPMPVSGIFCKESVRKLESMMRRNLDRILVRWKGVRERTGRRRRREVGLLPLFGRGALTDEVVSEYALCLVL